MGTTRLKTTPEPPSMEPRPIIRQYPQPAMASAYPTGASADSTFEPGRGADALSCKGRDLTPLIPKTPTLILICSEPYLSSSLKLGFKGTVLLPEPGFAGLLGGSWVAINGLISPLIWVINLATLLITLNPKTLNLNHL